MDSDTDRLVDRLIELGILSEADEGDAVRFGDEFLEVRDGLQGLADDDEKWEESVENLGKLGNWVDSTVITDAKAIEQFSDEFGREFALRIALSLRHIENPPSADGAPDNFVTLSGPEIEPFIESNPVSVVYFWREECEPCESVRSRLEEIEQSGLLEGVGKGAVYGPNSMPYVYEAFDVGAAPTTLFCVDGRVDARLVGDHATPIFESEIEILRERLPEPR